jgi:hypothetical protein
MSGVFTKRLTELSELKHESTLPVSNEEMMLAIKSESFRALNGQRLFLFPLFYRIEIEAERGEAVFSRLNFHAIYPRILRPLLIFHRKKILNHFQNTATRIHFLALSEGKDPTAFLPFRMRKGRQITTGSIASIISPVRKCERGIPIRVSEILRHLTIPLTVRPERINDLIPPPFHVSEESAEKRGRLTVYAVIRIENSASGGLQSRRSKAGVSISANPVIELHVPVTFYSDRGAHRGNLVLFREVVESRTKFRYSVTKRGVRVCSSYDGVRLLFRLISEGMMHEGDALPYPGYSQTIFTPLPDFGIRIEKRRFDYAVNRIYFLHRSEGIDFGPEDLFASLTGIPFLPGGRCAFISSMVESARFETIPFDSVHYRKTKVSTIPPESIRGAASGDRAASPGHVLDG